LRNKYSQTYWGTDSSISILVSCQKLRKPTSCTYITPRNPHIISSCMYVQFCHIMNLLYKYSGLLLSTMVHTTQFPSSLHRNHYWYTHTHTHTHTYYSMQPYKHSWIHRVSSAWNYMYAQHRAVLETPCSVQESCLTFFFEVIFFRNHPAN